MGMPNPTQVLVEGGTRLMPNPTQVLVDGGTRLMLNPTQVLVDGGTRLMLNPTEVYIDGGTRQLFLPHPAMFVLSCLELGYNLLQARMEKKKKVGKKDKTIYVVPSAPADLASD